MSAFQFFVRLSFAAIVFGAGVLIWALVPYIQGAHDPAGDVVLSVQWLSIFFGTATPAGYTVILLLFARAFISLALASWIFIPAFRFFVDADYSALTRGIVLIFLGLCVISFFSALVVHSLVYS